MNRLEDLQVFRSRDSSYVALQGRIDRDPVNIRVRREAIDDLDTFSPGATTDDQRIAFARHNREAIAAIAQAKIDRGEFEDEDWHGRDALAVRVSIADFAAYLQHPGTQVSLAAFDPRVQPKWGRDGRF
jgi:hypothetical protein